VARIRSVKPEMRKSHTVCSWPYPVRWTFVGLPGYVDDLGRGLDDVRLIKAELYPLDDDMTVRKLDQHLAEIAASGPLCRYEVDGKRYLHLVSWDEHQKVNRPSPSRIPPCPKHEPSPSAQVSLTEDSVSPHGARIEPSSSSRAPAEQGTGNREQVAPDKPPRVRDELFEALIAECGIDPGSLTKSGRGAVNAALGQLRAVEASPVQVQLRARRFRERYREITLTPAALAKHWGSLNGTTPGNAKPPGWEFR
jgi:hypothetical protein